MSLYRKFCHYPERFCFIFFPMHPCYTFIFYKYKCLSPGFPFPFSDVVEMWRPVMNQVSVCFSEYWKDQRFDLVLLVQGSNWIEYVSLKKHRLSILYVCMIFFFNYCFILDFHLTHIFIYVNRSAFVLKFKSLVLREKSVVDVPQCHKATYRSGWCSYWVSINKHIFNTKILNCTVVQ